MNDKLFNALEICLQALENGETLDSALARFPHLQAELRSLLETSRHARTLAGPPPSDATRRLGRARLLQRAAEMREQKRAPKRTWLYNFRPLAVTLTLVAIFLTSTNLVRASSGALPGDNLYQVKRAWEGMRLLVAFNAEVRETIELEYENERLHEIDELLAYGREEPVTFSGYVATQEKGLWTVAGVPVRVSDQTILSNFAIGVGAGVQITGQTDADGFLVAQSIILLPAGTIIPPLDDEAYEEEHGEDDDEESENSLGEVETPTPVPTVIGIDPTETPSPTGTATATETETETEKENEKENEKEEEKENEEEEEEEETEEDDD